MQVQALVILLSFADLGLSQSSGNQSGRRTLHGPKPSYLSAVPCPTEAYFRHPRNCQKFYRCVDVFNSGRQLSVYEGTCDQGLIFDEKISSCNWPELADPCPSNEELRDPYKPKDHPPKVITKPPFSQEEDNEVWQELAEVESPTETEVSETSPPFSQQDILSTVELANPSEEIVQETARPPFTNPAPKPTVQTTKKPCMQQEVRPTEASATSPQTTQPVNQQDILSDDWWIPDDKETAPQVVRQPEINNDPVFCEKEGFFRHPGNCSRFYRCVSNEASFDIYTFDCPQLLVFNETESSCTRPLDAECATHESAYRHLRIKRSVVNNSPSALPCPKEGFFRHPSNCQAFYRCVSRRPSARPFSSHIFTCPNNLVFDEAKATCNWPQKSAPCDTTSDAKSDTSSSKIPPRQKPKNRTTPTARVSENKKVTPTRSTTSRPKKIKQKVSQPLQSSRPQSLTVTGPKCKSPGFFASRTDCNKYYKCVDDGKGRQSFIRYDFECPQNLAFDEKTITCKSPNLVSYCKTSKIALLVRQNDDSNPPPTTPTEESSRETPESRDNQDDDIVCEKEGYFRHPKDCNKFYRCVDFNGDGAQYVRYDFACPEGLVFDELNSVCNWPSLSPACEDGKGSGDGSRNEGDNSTDSSSTTEDASSIRSSSTSRPTDSVTGTDFQTTPGPTAEGSSSTDQGGLETTPTSESGGRATGSSSTSATSDIQCAEEGFFRNPEDCNKFYRCVDFRGDGQQFVRYDFSCPEDLVFDELNGVCNWPTLSPPCGDSSSKTGKPTEGSTSSSNENTQPEIQTSSTATSSGIESTTESPAESTTEGPSESTTADSDITEATEATSGTVTSSEITGVTESTGATSENTTPRGGETTPRSTPSSQEPIQCTEAGYFRNPNDCNKFYRCVDFRGDGQQYVRYDFSCPEGLVFDEVNSVCNWPNMSPECDSSGGRNATESPTSSPSSQSTTDTPDAGRTTAESGEMTSSTSSATSSGTNGTTIPSTDQTTSETDRATSETDETTSDTDRTTSETDETTSEREETSSTTEASGSTTLTTEATVTSTAVSTTASEGTGNETDSTSSSSTPSSETTKEQTSSSETDAEIQCTQEGFFRNPNDCSKFYRCVDFRGDGRQYVRYDFECPEGLVFDEVNSVCNWPSSSPPCQGGTSEPEATTPSNSTDTSTTSGTSSETESSQTTTTGEDISSTSESSTAAPTQTTESTEAPTQTTGSQTTDQVTSEGTTPTQTTEIQGTTSDSVTSVETTVTSETTDNGSVTTERAVSPTDATDQTTTSGESSTSQGTNIECTKEGFFRHPDDCGKFYRCVDFRGDGQQFVRYDFECPEGLVFDEVNSVCNWPTMTPSCESVGKEGTSTPETPLNATGTTESTSSSTSDLTTGQEESNLTTDSSATDRDGTPSSTSTTTPSSSECNEEGFFRDPNDCRRYYRCVQSDDGTFEVQEFSCNEDEVFDEERLFCNKKELSPPCPAVTGNGTEPTDSTEFVTEQTTTQGITREESSTTEFPDTSTSESTGGGSSTTAPPRTTTDSSQDIECTEEGFFRHPEDCSKFYRCVDFSGDGRSFVRYDFVCPEGLVFDEVNSVCNWPTLTPSCNTSSGSTTSTQEGTSSSTTVTTEGGTVTSGTSTQGETESTAPSDGRTETSPSSTSEGESTSAVTTQGQTEGSSSAMTEVGTTSTETSRDQTESSSSTVETSPQTPKEETTNIQCTEAGFFRHPDDCTKFYRCVDFRGTGEQFVRYDFDCPEGLVFDETVSVCNWPHDSPPCDNARGSTESGTSAPTTQVTTSGATESTTERPESTQSSTEEESTTTETTNATTDATSTTSRDSSTQQTTESPSESSTNCTEEGFFRDPDDCSKYFQCSINQHTEAMEKKEFSCPEGHVFDEEGRYCNAIELSPPCGNTTAFECTEEGFFRDPNDCSHYIQCIRDNQTEEFEKRYFKCPKDHVFDEEGRYCNAKELSPPCEESGSTTSTEGSTPSGEGSTTSGEGSTTSAEGSTTDSTTTNDLSGGSTTQSGDEPECAEEGFFRDPEDCSRYYQCVRRNDTSEGFEKRTFTCPEDHIFDEEGRYCNSIELSPPCNTSDTSQTTTEGGSTSDFQTTDSGGDGSTITESSPTTAGGSTTLEELEETESTTSGTVTVEPSSTTDSRTTSDSRTTDSSSPSTTKSTNQETVECTEAGFFRNPNDCGKFYRCVDFAGTGESFVRYDFDCPEGLVFDELNSVCTWPTLSPPCNAGSQEIQRGKVE